MKYDKKEPIEKWAERVQMFEYGEALKRIANGEPVDTVMQSMSKKIVEKLKHPMILHIKEWGESTYNATVSQDNYKKNYLDISKPVADHMNDVDDLN